jgi:ferritin
MLSENLLKALTRQINREIYSAYFYAAMASYAQSQGFKGAAHWFSQQVKEEIEHAQRMYDYVQQQNKRVMMEAIEAPPQDFQSIADLYKRTLEHEKKVTGLIKDLVNLARQEKDSQTEEFLQWYVKEQIEEEATPAKILKTIEAEGTTSEGLKKIDEKLSIRK